MADARCISGGDEADGAAGFSGDEDNYGYKNHVDDDDNSEQEPDFANRSALGPKDGEGEADETYLVAFRAMCGRIPAPLATNIIKLLYYKRWGGRVPSGRCVWCPLLEVICSNLARCRR